MSRVRSSCLVFSSVAWLRSSRSAVSMVTNGGTHSRACSWAYASTPVREPSRYLPIRMAYTGCGSRDTPAGALRLSVSGVGATGATTPAPASPR